MASRSHRLAEYDVARAVVLIGVFTMNYVVQWNLVLLRGGGWGVLPASEFMLQMFDPWRGPMSTRWAASMMMLLGMGTALGSARVVRSGDKEAIREQRWRLRRRGVLFILIGVMFDAVWPGEVLHYAGTYLIIAAWTITWRRTALLAAAIVTVIVTAAQRIAVFHFVSAEESATSWWSGATEGGFGRASVGTPRGFMSSVLSWGGHPVLPWMAFVFVGMALTHVLILEPQASAPGELAPPLARRRLTLMTIGALLLVSGYSIQTIGYRWLPDRWHWAASVESGGFGRTSPFGLGMPAYVFATCGSSILGIVLISWIASRFPNFLPIRVLARGGQMTFTIYLLHGLIPWALVHYEVITPDFGLVWAIATAAGSWAAAVVIMAGFHKWRGIGPMEWLLRRISG